MDKKNAEKGAKHERLFSNSLKNELGVIAKIKEHFNIDGDFTKSYPTGAAGGKADVIVSFTGGSHLRANVKSFGKVGVNQATRGTVESFAEHCDLQDLKELLTRAVVRKSSGGKFILEEEKDQIVEAVTSRAKKIVQFALARLEEPELLVLYNNVSNIMYVYDLANVLENLSYDVSVSTRSNIMIGEHFLFHRKGGDGNSTRFEKTSPFHPGNNLAVKLFCKKFVSNVKPVVSYKPNEKKT